MDNNNYVDYSKPDMFDKPPKRKINWIGFALTLILIGGIMAGGAWMAGARGGALRWDNRPVFFSTPIGTGQTQSVTISAGNINELLINSSSARVRVKTNQNSNDFLVDFVGLPANYTVDRGRLIIDGRLNNVITGINIFNIRSGNYEVNVYVPPGMTLEMTIASSSGRVEVQYPYFNALNIRTSSGRIEVERAEIPGGFALSSSSGLISVANVIVPNGVFSSSSGRIEISDSHFDNLYISSSSGRQEIENSSWNNLVAGSSSGSINIDDAIIRSAAGSTTIAASSGRVELTVVGSESDFNYNLRSTSGSIRVNGDRRESRNAGNLHDITIRTTSGSIRLNFD